MISSTSSPQKQTEGSVQNPLALKDFSTTTKATETPIETLFEVQGKSMVLRQAKSSSEGLQARDVPWAQKSVQLQRVED